MPWYAYSLVAMATIAAWVAIHHGTLGIRLRDRMQQSFALLALAVALECLVRLWFFNSTTLAGAVRADRMSWMVEILQCWLLADFTIRFNGQDSRRFMTIVTWASLALFGLFWALPHGFHTAPPQAIQIVATAWGEPFLILVGEYGFGYWCLVTLALTIIGHALTMSWLAWRRTHRRRHLALIGSLVLLVAAVATSVISDALGHPLVVLIDHAFAALALIMGLVLTEQALKTAQLEERIQRQARINALGQLAGGVAHDFGNILTGIVAGSDLLISRLHDRPTEQELARTVASSGQHGAALVRQLLAFARGRPLAHERVLINPLIQEVTTMLRSGFGAHLKLDLRLGPVTIAVEGDPAELHSLILNLVINARDAMQGQASGTLRIETGFAAPTDPTRLRHVPRPGQLVALTFSDQGPGIPADVMPHIFDSFYTTKNASGSGLGLAQVDKALIALGGAIEIESTPGAGATFKVWLPVAEGSSTTMSAAGTRVLVWVEDATLQHLIVQTLHAFGYQALPYVAGADQSAIAALVVDLDHPELLRDAALLAKRFAKVPKVGLSHARLSSTPGVEVVLTKPVAPQAITTTLMQLLKG